MTDTTSHDLEPWALRLAAACQEMLAAMTPADRAEFYLLALLDPDSSPGMSVRNLDDALIEVRWAGRPLGAIRRAWLFEDES